MFLYSAPLQLARAGSKKLIMLGNYIKIAGRNLRKGKIYSFINITGLASGMAITLLIGLWIWDELSFDAYHKHHNRLAQVMTTQTNNGTATTFKQVAIPLREELRTKHGADFKQMALVSWNSPGMLAAGEKKVSAMGLWVEPEFPAMFTLKMLKGSGDALKDPSSVLLTETLAKALFGDADPLQKIVRLDNRMDVTVAGVYEDLPPNTTLHAVKFLMPWSRFIVEKDLQPVLTNWGNHSFRLYVQMNDHVDPDKTTAKIKYIPRQHGMAASNEEIMLHPMDKWRLHSEFRNGKVTGGRIQFVWLFGAIGLFILLLACINFMNLSTARSEKRAREVGIRKAMGSLRWQLIGQFLSESLLVAFLAFLLAIILVYSTLPFFNGLADKQMFIPWGNPVFWLLLLGFTLLTGIVSGSYPAFYLSAFAPLKVLKGTFAPGRSGSLPRKILVVTQFTVSIALIIGTIVIFRQIAFAKDRPVGYNREGLIAVMINTPELYGHYDAIRNDLLATGAVQNMAESSSPSTGVWNNYGDISWKGRAADASTSFGMVAVSHDLGKTINWTMKEGRDFSRDFPTDSGAFILNEAAVKLIGFEEPVGKVMKWEGEDRVVVGVVKDMVMESPYNPVKPTIFFLQYEWANVITIRIKPTMSATEALAAIGPVFRKYNPESPFEYEFTDLEYAKKFDAEKRIGNLATFFAALAIFISCLGLFGLASFVAEQRTKEIGVRKVLGASVFNLWKMLSREFVVLVILSCLVAIPLASYFLHQWLQQYEYRTQLSWWIFALTGLGALVITLLTVSYQAIKAALMNPVKSLRAE